MLGKILDVVRHFPGKARVLDIGFGTEVLTTRLYELGHTISGVDFPSRMVAIAAEKMPLARLVRFDIQNGLPEHINKEKFDIIISTYALHHLPDTNKITFIQNLLDLLAPGGKILIGDVAFDSRVNLEKCKAACGTEWDTEEFYFVMDEITPRLAAGVTFEAASHCAGVIVIQR